VSVTKLILLILGSVFVVPALAFLCMKWGTAGFYKGKEAIKRANEVSNNEGTEN